MADMIDREVLVRVYKLLPLTDCGQCGLKTCREFAEMLLTGEKKIHNCAPLEGESAGSITLILEDYFR